MLGQLVAGREVKRPIVWVGSSVGIINAVRKTTDKPPAFMREYLTHKQGVVAAQNNAPGQQSVLYVGIRNRYLKQVAEAGTDAALL